MPYTPTCACDGAASVFAGEYCHRALPDGAEPRSLGCLREKPLHSGGGTTRDLDDVSDWHSCLTSGPRTCMRETATWVQRHLATTMVVETGCTPIRRPRRLAMAREWACDAPFVTETATYRHQAIKHRGRAPVFSRSFRAFGRSASNHNNYANLCTRPGGGSEAPLRRSYLLCGPAAATQWQNAAPVKITKTTRIELGRPRAGGQNGPGMGLEQFSNDVLVGDLVRPRDKRLPSQTNLAPGGASDTDLTRVPRKSLIRARSRRYGHRRRRARSRTQRTKPRPALHQRPRIPG